MCALYCSSNLIFNMFTEGTLRSACLQRLELVVLFIHIFSFCFHPCKILFSVKLWAILKTLASKLYYLMVNWEVIISNVESKSSDANLGAARELCLLFCLFVYYKIFKLKLDAWSKDHFLFWNLNYFLSLDIALIFLLFFFITVQTNVFQTLDQILLSQRWTVLFSQIILFTYVDSDVFMLIP